MKGWPKPKEVQRQTWLATNALALADALNVTMESILEDLKKRTETGRAATVEEALRQLYALFEQPAPEGDGQLHLIINDGAIFAPWEESSE